MDIQHKTSGLTRRCNAHDLFLSADGLVCGNCLASEAETARQKKKDLSNESAKAFIKQTSARRTHHHA